MFGFGKKKKLEEAHSEMAVRFGLIIHIVYEELIKGFEVNEEEFTKAMAYLYKDAVLYKVFSSYNMSGSVERLVEISYEMALNDSLTKVIDEEGRNICINEWYTQFNSYNSIENNKMYNKAEIGTDAELIVFFIVFVYMNECVRIAKEYKML